jgi:hypothetical protein
MLAASAMEPIKYKWRDLSPRSKSMVVTAAAVQLALLACALVDIRSRPPDQLRGRKALWIPALFVNFAGPISYLVFGRRRSDD